MSAASETGLRTADCSLSASSRIGPCGSPSPQWLTERCEFSNDYGAYTTSIWLVPVTAGDPRRIVSLPREQSILNAWAQMSWTPDSRQLLTARNSSTGASLWLIDVDSGRERKLDIDVSGWNLAGGGPWGGFALSPDGRSIAFLMGKAGPEVWALENFLK